MRQQVTGGVEGKYFPLPVGLDSTDDPYNLFSDIESILDDEMIKRAARGARVFLIGCQEKGCDRWCGLAGDELDSIYRRFNPGEPILPLGELIQLGFIVRGKDKLYRATPKLISLYQKEYPALSSV